MAYQPSTDDTGYSLVALIPGSTTLFFPAANSSLQIVTCTHSCSHFAPFAPGRHKSHAIDHTAYDFTSILRYIGNTHHLPRLSQYDRHATSIGHALNVTQRPLPPLILPQQRCRAFRRPRSRCTAARRYHLFSVGRTSRYPTPYTV